MHLSFTKRSMIGTNWDAIVTAVHKRDRHQCMNCYRERDDVTLDVHHAVPRGRGGSNRLSNLILLCRQCHDAAHGQAMAPRVKWYTNGQMDTDEFELFRQLFASMDIARFDDEERCWYIPKGDAEQLVETDEDDEPSDADTVQAVNSLASYM